MQSLSIVASNSPDDPITSPPGLAALIDQSNTRHMLTTVDEVPYDTESHLSSWICVFGSFLLLIPSYGA
jgi:hypothetical protein